MAEQTMVERVALAIQGPLGISTADAVFAAKRAIEAMREPTEDMCHAVGAGFGLAGHGVG